MKIALINGSPKKTDSTSGVLLHDLKSCFPADLVISEFHFTAADVSAEVVSQLARFDALVFAFPVYVDGIPSHLLSCLSIIHAHGIENKAIKVYGISNCGFYEGIHNQLALEVLENWSVKTGLQWGQGVGVGGGAPLAQMSTVPLGKGPKKSLGKGLQALAGNIEQKKGASNIYLSISMPRFIYKIAAEMVWRQRIKKNGGKVKDLNRRL